MKLEKLVEDYRNGVLENVHYGQVCIVNEQGDVINQVGDVSTITYLRSAAKPFQALPIFKECADEQLSISEKEASIFMASQRGEEYHVDVLKSLKDKLGIDENILVCSESYPLNDEPKEKYIYHHGEKRKLLHNCAGKHLGFLALTKALQAPLETYSELEGPAQQMSLEATAHLMEMDKKDIKLGIDGCGFPVYALPLQNIAKGYLKLANLELIEDEGYRVAAKKVGRLMNEYSQMIASHNFVCTTLLNDPNIVAKGGAKGVYGIGLRDERLGISLKVIDGSEDVWPNIIAHILESINYKNKETIQALYELSPKQLKNDGDTVVGERKVVFTI